jgi:hypothetical protein
LIAGDDEALAALEDDVFGVRGFSGEQEKNQEERKEDNTRWAETRGESGKIEDAGLKPRLYIFGFGSGGEAGVVQAG